jgi:murein DD-endopeptidase MepM/ murein hydrolase activator NlpD
VKADELQTQADDAAASAKDSEVRAGQLAAQIARTGSNDLTLNLLLNGDDASDLLAMMGQAGKVSEQANGIYEKAVQDRNTAQALTDQADVAQDLLEGLKIKAADALKVAQDAEAAATAAYDASEAHKAELDAQLAALTTNRAATEAQYKKGEQVRKAAAAKKAAAEAAAAAKAGAGSVGSSGWAKPANGYISSGFGYRVAPTPGVNAFHSGTDIAGGCGIPIRAAHKGTVVYAGWYGTYGNFVLIDNGNGIQTGYAHIVNGGIKVDVGEYVQAGEKIASVGTTGASTGCHLHFEVRKNGTAVNAVPFMRSKGITLG